MSEEKDASQRVLEGVEKDIQKALDNDKASDHELLLAVLRALKTEVPFLLQFASDHQKVETMWRFYLITVGVLGSLGALILVLLWAIFTHDVSLVHGAVP